MVPLPCGGIRFTYLGDGLVPRVELRIHAVAKSLQARPTCSDPVDCSLPGSSIHGIFQARVLEWVAVARTLHFHPGALRSSSASPTAPPGGCAGSIPTAAHSPVA